MHTCFAAVRNKPIREQCDRVLFQILNVQIGLDMPTRRLVPRPRRLRPDNRAKRMDSTSLCHPFCHLLYPSKGFPDPLLAIPFLKISRNLLRGLRIRPSVAGLGLPLELPRANLWLHRYMLSLGRIWEYFLSSGHCLSTLASESP